MFEEPTFERMVRKGGLDRFLEYSILIEVLNHRMKDRKRALMEVVRRYPKYLDLLGAAFGFSKRQLRVVQKRATGKSIHRRTIDEILSSVVHLGFLTAS